MEQFFFFVTGSDAWKATKNFHVNFFCDHNAFLYGILIALVVAAMLAIGFYFGCANNKHDNSLANLSTWVGFGVATALVVFLIADFGIIGKSKTKDYQSVFYKYSFYKANKDFVVEQTRDNPNEQLVSKLNSDKQKIDKELNNGKGVRYGFSLGCAVYSLIFFYLFSILMKGFTYQGIAIPHKWPYKNN